MNKVILIIMTALLTGCSDRPLNQISATKVISDRVSVSTVAELTDQSALGGVRQVWVITDKKTGNEYLAISGGAVVTISYGKTAVVQSHE